jgi:hypothetical protein
MGMKPYGVYLASRQVSEHETFDEALVEYSKRVGQLGLNMRNGERSDVDTNGLTEDEKEAIECVKA